MNEKSFITLTPGLNFIKTVFPSSLTTRRNKLGRLFLESLFNQVKYYWGRPGAHHITEYPSTVLHLARLCWLGSTGLNTPAYFTSLSVTRMKCFQLWFKNRETRGQGGQWGCWGQDGGCGQILGGNFEGRQRNRNRDQRGQVLMQCSGFLRPRFWGKIS